LKGLIFAFEATRSGALKANALPERSPAPSRPRCQGRVGFAFIGAQRRPLAEEAGGLGAVFSQEGQRGKKDSSVVNLQKTVAVL